MVSRIIEYCARNRAVVLLGVAIATLASAWSISRTKIDAIPPGSHKRLASIEKFVFSSLGKEVDSW